MNKTFFNFRFFFVFFLGNYSGMIGVQKSVNVVNVFLQHHWPDMLQKYVPGGTDFCTPALGMNSYLRGSCFPDKRTILTDESQSAIKAFCDALSNFEIRFSSFRQ